MPQLREQLKARTTSPPLSPRFLLSPLGLSLGLGLSLSLSQPMPQLREQLKARTSSPSPPLFLPGSEPESGLSEPSWGFQYESQSESQSESQYESQSESQRHSILPPSIEPLALPPTEKSNGADA